MFLHHATRTTSLRRPRPVETAPRTRELRPFLPRSHSVEEVCITYGSTVLFYKAIAGTSHATTSCSSYQATEIIFCSSTITQCWQGMFLLLICVCMYVLFVCVYVCTTLYVCMYVCVYVCVCVFVCVYVCMCLLCTYVCVIYTSMCMCL